MADNSENIGGVSVSITGDLSDLQSAFAEAQSQAQTAGQNIANAFTGSITGLADYDAAIQKAVSSSDDLQSSAVQTAGSVGDLSEAVSGAGTEAAAAAPDIQSLGEAATEAGSASAKAAGDIGELGTSATGAGEAAKESSGGLGSLVEEGLALGGIVVGVEALKGLAEEALASYSAVEQATVAITQMTGSAQTATGIIEGLKDVAISDALSFPNLVTAEQRMIAFGFSISSIPAALQAAADASAATGKSFDSVTSAMDRMTLSGTTSSRQLATLGLSTQDLAAVMGVSASEVAADFKAMDPSDRLVVIEEALGKFSGAAQAMSQTVAGEWQNLKTEADFAFEGVGAALAPIAQTVLPAASAAVHDFAGVWSSAMEVLSTVGTAAGSVVNAIEAIAKPVADQVTSVPLLKTAWQDFLNVIENYNTYALVASGIKGISNEITILTGGFDKINSSIATAMQNFSAMATTFAGGKTAADALALSFAQAKADAAGLGFQIPAVTAAMQNDLTAAQTAATNYQTAQAAYQALSDAYNSGQTVLNGVAVSAQAVAIAHQNLTTAAKAAGIQIEDNSAGTQVYAGIQDIQAAATAVAADKQTLLAQQVDQAGQALFRAQQNVENEQQAINDNVGSTDNLIAAKVKAQSALAAYQKAQEALTAAEYADAAGQQAQLGPGNQWGIVMMNQNTQMQALAAALAQAQANLQKLTTTTDDSTNSAQKYLSAQKSVLTAQENLDVAQAEAAASFGGSTDAVTLYQAVLAGAQAKLNDVTVAWHNNQATAEQVLSAQKAVTTAQNELNAAMGQTPAAANNATQAMIAFGNAATVAASAEQQFQQMVTAANSAMGASYATNASGLTADQANYTYLGNANLLGAYESGIAQAMAQHAPYESSLTPAQQKIAPVASLGVIPNTGSTTATSTVSAAPSSSAASAAAIITSLPSGTVVTIDELNGGTLYGQLDNLLTLLESGSSATMALSTSVGSLTTATATAASDSSAAAAATVAAATSTTTAISSVAGAVTMVADGVTSLATAVSTLGTSLKNVLGAPVAIAGVPSGTTYAATGGGGTNVVGGTVTSSIGPPGGGAVGYGISFNFYGNVGGPDSKSAVMDAVTQALRTAGARF